MSETRVDAKAHTAQITFKHLVLRGNRLEETFTERGILALYKVEEMETLLSEAGLTPLAMLDWVRKTFEPHRPEDFRVFAVARRDR